MVSSMSPLMKVASSSSPPFVDRRKLDHLSRIDEVRVTRAQVGLVLFDDVSPVGRHTLIGRISLEMSGRYLPEVVSGDDDGLVGCSFERLGFYCDRQPDFSGGGGQRDAAGHQSPNDRDDQQCTTHATNVSRQTNQWKGVTIAQMKVRIGISTTDKVLELEIDDAEAFQKEMEKAVVEGGLGWFTDSKGRTVGIPARSVAFIEVEDADGQRTVGFAPAG